MRRTRLLLLFPALLSGCAAVLPVPTSMPVPPVSDSCRVRSVALSARGKILPAVPLMLQTEHDRFHFSGALLGDWGRLLESFSLAKASLGGERAWFSGSHLSPGQLSSLAIAVQSPRSLAPVLPRDWTLVSGDSVVTLLFCGKPSSVWTRHPADSLWDGRASDSSWDIRSASAGEETQPLVAEDSLGR